MKKIIVLVLILSVFSVSAFFVVGALVIGEQENVTFKENVIYGDRAYANGVNVFFRSHYDNHLFWNTSYTIGDESKTETDFEFHYNAFVDPKPRKGRGAILKTDFPYYHSYDDLLAGEPVGLKMAYRELYDETPVGETGTKTVRLQDYYDYYPIGFFTLSLPGVDWMAHNYDDLTGMYKNIRDVWDAFNEFIKIPIPEDLPAIEIELKKIGENHLSTRILGSYYQIESASAYTSTQCFFSITTDYDGKRVDTSQIPGGYGIYAFSYQNSGNKAYGEGIDTDSLAMVYPLGQCEEVVHMMVSEDETKLLAFTAEQGRFFLTVIDIATMTELQKIFLDVTTNFEITEYDTCIVLRRSDAVAKQHLVIEKQEDGLYRFALRIMRWDKGGAEDMAFDGEKLVIVNQADYPIGCGFKVEVYDKRGLLYYAEYESSLSYAAGYGSGCLPVRCEVDWNSD